MAEPDFSRLTAILLKSGRTPNAPAPRARGRDHSRQPPALLELSGLTTLTASASTRSLARRLLHKAVTRAARVSPDYIKPAWRQPVHTRCTICSARALRAG